MTVNCSNFEITSLCSLKNNQNLHFDILRLIVISYRSHKLNSTQPNQRHSNNFDFHFFPFQLSEDIGYVLYSALGSFYIPSCIMVFVYIRIYFAAKARARRGIKKKPQKQHEQVSTLQQLSPLYFNFNDFQRICLVVEFLLDIDIIQCERIQLFENTLTHTDTHTLTSYKYIKVCPFLFYDKTKEKSSRFCLYLKESVLPFCRLSFFFSFSHKMLKSNLCPRTRKSYEVLAHFMLPFFVPYMVCHRNEIPSSINTRQGYPILLI